MELKTLIRQREVMEMLGISRSKYYKLSHEPDFPSLKIGRYTYVDKNRLNEWIDSKIQQNRTVTETN